MSIDVLKSIEESLSTRTSVPAWSDIAALIEYVKVTELYRDYLMERHQEKFWVKGVTQESIMARLRRAREKLGLEKW